MVHLPEGTTGWTVFVFGLLLVAYRVHGIDAPRPWIEWVERQFVNTRLLQIIGGCLVIASVVLAYASTVPTGILGWLYVISCAVLFTLGVSLIGAINHLRHLVVATAEVDDKYIRMVSIGITVLGLLWALAPWFL